LEKQKELTERVRANEKVVAAIGLFGSVALAFIGAGYFAPKAEAHMGHDFPTWPTAGEMIEAIRSKKLSCMLVGSGGLRNGLDVAKVVRIGADIGAAAQPFLEPARSSLNKTVQIIKSWEKDFKIAMFSTGSKNLAELKIAKLLAGGSRSDTGD